MPYTKVEDREAVVKNVFEIKTPGDLNYFITLAILDAWKQHPKYETIHALEMDFVVDTKRNKFLQALRSRLADRFTVADINTAAACAYAEFERRVVAKYEEKKIALNGDLPEYVEAIEALQ